MDVIGQEFEDEVQREGHHERRQQDQFFHAVVDVVVWGQLQQLQHLGLQEENSIQLVMRKPVVDFPRMELIGIKLILRHRPRHYEAVFARNWSLFNLLEKLVSCSERVESRGGLASHVYKQIFDFNN